MIPEYLQEYRPTYEQYKESRKRPGIPNARAALHNAKYSLYRAALRRRWNDAGDSRVRIVTMPDDLCGVDDLKGDCFNPDVNDNINPNRLAREEREFEERVANEGVWGFRAEYWNGAEWIETDSIWGFVGDDFIGSNYDDDLMESALDGLQQCLASEARAIEATRPDLYAIA